MTLFHVFALVLGLSLSSLAGPLTPNLLNQRDDELPCPIPNFTLNNLKWFDSAHTFECGGRGADPTDTKYCPYADPSSSCFNSSQLCMTGVPPLFNYQPPGYGPPSWININVTHWAACNVTQNSVVPYTPLNGGPVKCGSTATPFWFRSNSTQGANDATFRIQPYVNCPVADDGRWARYIVEVDARLELRCERDGGGNATCVTVPEVVELPAKWTGDLSWFQMNV